MLLLGSHSRPTRLMEDIPHLLITIDKIKSRGGFKKYIDFIQFPFFRNIEVNTKISFRFPLTVFVGQNGCGKSSCLHALYGAPAKYTPYEFWFETKVDPVKYYNDTKRRHSFWYSYLDDKQKKREVIKARIRREGDPNYWETSRPLDWAGMKPRKTRDKPIDKEVVYLDFRAELSAFDKYFYFGNLINSKAKNKQEFIRRKSASLKKLFDGTKDEIRSSKRALNNPVRNLSQDELNCISFILGRSYTGGRSVLHELYRSEGYSVQFETNFAKYSEAVAGSGEIAVVRLVKEVLAAPRYSLILLDEPEVSLHPGAQIRLKTFLLEQIKLKQHQIVLTSHSPSIIDHLPRESIKVFYQNPSNGRFLVKEGLLPEEAFLHIEYPISNRINITVEDTLAKEILCTTLEEIGDETRNLFHVKFNPGGVTVIKREFAPVFCRNSNSREFIIFDGDQKPRTELCDWRDLPTTRQSETELRKVIKEQCGEQIVFSSDSGSSEKKARQQIAFLKSYLDYYRRNVRFFPKQTPEEIIWDDDTAHQLLRMIILDDQEVDTAVLKLQQTDDYKRKFSLLCNLIMGDSTSTSISSLQKQFIKKWVQKKNEDYQAISSIVRDIAEKANPTPLLES